MDRWTSNSRLHAVAQALKRRGLWAVIAIRIVPLDRIDAEEMIDDLATRSLLGEFRGEPAVDRNALADVLVGLSAAAEADPAIESADLNPLIVADGKPVAVDALVEVREADDV